MTNKAPAAALALVMVATGIGATRLPPPVQAAGTDEVLPALLAEMKALRAAMEQIASGGTQAQIATGRLQVQERRVTRVADRLEAVHDALESARNELAGTMESLETLETPEMVAALPAPDRERERALIKASVANAKARVSQLTAEEAQLSAELAAEQQRWIDIDQRVGELERSLSRR